MKKEISILYIFRLSWFLTLGSQPITVALQWRHNVLNGISNHWPHDYSSVYSGAKKTSKLCVTGLCEGNSPMTGEFPAKGPVTREIFPFDYVIMRRIITAHHTMMWCTNTRDKWGINDSTRGSAKSGIVLFPMMRRYWSATIKLLYLFYLILHYRNAWQ